eukprot:1193326-Prorocentrum_minimum.AAC.1
MRNECISHSRRWDTAVAVHVLLEHGTHGLGGRCCWLELLAKTDVDCSSQPKKSQIACHQAVNPILGHAQSLSRASLR